jgi:hypothetical protein
MDVGHYLASPERRIVTINPLYTWHNILKYRPGYPASGMRDLGHARAWVLKLIRWYNNEHRHNGLNFLTPEQRHSELGEAILASQSNRKRGRLHLWFSECPCGEKSVRQDE